jgi:ferrous iron transport protein B
MTGPKTVLLVGNPNVGKSTLFNALTGLRQHTGNWAGKTVETAQGRYLHQGREYRLVDLPGTYSLSARSREEQVTRQALEGRDYDCVVVVCDGTLLRRNLILVYQVLGYSGPVVVCLNLMDQARRQGITVDKAALSQRLGVPVVETAAGRSEGLEDLQDAVAAAIEAGARKPLSQESKSDRAALARETAKAVTAGTSAHSWGAAWDRLLTGKRTALPCLLLLLIGLLWLTIAGANRPSQWLWTGVQALYGVFSRRTVSWPWWLRGALLDGVWRTAGRVLSVMLPPMAIFFPLFTLLEDLGLLPRMAYDLDHPMSCCGACGKMALTMCMGLGCNAAGVTGCRILEGDRERKLAIVTNSFIPCNGRFGALILLLTSCLVPAAWGSLGSALGLTGLILLSILVTLGVCWVLSRTVLRDSGSTFVLELPPYRMPQVGQVVVRSLLDRTLRVLGRAATVAAPAGLLLWVLSTVTVADRSLLGWLTAALDPLGHLLGMNGVLLAAFILGWPANEIVLPIALLAVSGTLDLEATTLGALGLTWETALCTALFFLFHWPCATTCLTIRRETGSLKWTLAAMALPTAVGAALCILVHGLFRLL